MEHHINADYSQLARMDAGEMEWIETPTAGVWRKRFDLSGPEEAGRVTSLVRFDPGTEFPAHDHPNGEEILVLEGVFSDHQGDHGAGSYLLNPEGFRHQPWSEPGCLLFVKLQQYGGHGRLQLALDTEAMEWQPSGPPGVEEKMLYAQEEFDDRTFLVRLKAGTEIPHHRHPDGEEAYVIEGRIEDETGLAKSGCWARYPRGSSHQPRAVSDCIIYVKTGGLPADG